MTNANIPFNGMHWSLGFNEIIIEIESFINDIATVRSIQSYDSKRRSIKKEIEHEASKFGLNYSGVGAICVWRSPIFGLKTKLWSQRVIESTVWYFISTKTC